MGSADVSSTIFHENYLEHICFQILLKHVRVSSV